MEAPAQPQYSVADHPSYSPTYHQRDILLQNHYRQTSQDIGSCYESPVLIKATFSGLMSGLQNNNPIPMPK